jgi:hypothetical protein
MNQINVIHPYYDKGTWVFDDAAVGLKREPFVSGRPEIIEQLIEHLGTPPKFKLTFSKDSFPGSNGAVKWVRAAMGGNWYRYGDLEGWLCPALLRYFDDAPKEIHLKVEER